MWDVKPGDRVALKQALSVSAIERAVKNGIVIPELDKVYTVRECLVGWNGKTFEPGIRLVEIVNAPKRLEVAPGQADIIEMSFTLKKFRPVISLKGMETLRAALYNPKLIEEINPLDARKVKERT